MRDMTITIDRTTDKGAGMTDVLDDLRREIREVAEQAATVDRDPEAIAAALDRLTALYDAIEAVRHELADSAPALVVRALLAGIDRDDLIGRPYSANVVRNLAKEAGLPPRRPGPRRRSDRRKLAEVLAEMRDAPTVDRDR